MPACRVCRSTRLQFITDFGSLAITNQFVSSDGVPAYRQPMLWHQCLDCSVVQLAAVPPVEQIRCRFPWLTYREPERHLDETAEAVARISQLQVDDRVIGLTNDDVPLMKRLGSHQSLLIDPVDDLKVPNKTGRETINRMDCEKCCRRFAILNANVPIARYILEHARRSGISGRVPNTAEARRNSGH